MTGGVPIALRLTSGIEPRAGIVRVDGADRLAENDALPRPEPAARQHEGTTSGRLIRIATPEGTITAGACGSIASGESMQARRSSPAAMSE